MFKPYLLACLLVATACKSPGGAATVRADDDAAALPASDQTLVFDEVPAADLTLSFELADPALAAGATNFAAVASWESTASFSNAIATLGIKSTCFFNPGPFETAPVPVRKSVVGSVGPRLIVALPWALGDKCKRQLGTLELNFVDASGQKVRTFQLVTDRHQKALSPKAAAVAPGETVSFGTTTSAARALPDTGPAALGPTLAIRLAP
jgi:hypothetical protein